MAIITCQRPMKLFLRTWQRHHLMIAFTVVSFLSGPQSLIMNSTARHHGKSRPQRDASWLQCTLRNQWAASSDRGALLPPSPPAEKASARQDKAGKASTGDGSGNAHAATRDSVVETEPSSAAHRFTKCNLDTVRTSQQWDADQVV
jgi:hypothetical protein